MPQPPKKLTRPRPTSRDAANGEVTWEEAVERFLAEGRRMNLSTATLENYRSYLTGLRMRTFLTDQGIAGPKELTADRLRQLETELFEIELKPGTVATYHRVLKNFAGFCIERGYGAGSEVLKVRGPKQPQVEPDTFSPAEERKMLAALKARPRDRMMFQFMLATGVRLSEACAVTVDDIVESPDGAYVRVRQGKGRKDRIVPLDTPGNQLSAELGRYIDRVRPTKTNARFLFLTTRREGRDYAPLTPHGVQVMCRRLGHELGIHIHPHKFRHTFATRALSAGVNVMALQRALGHTTLAMVSRYVHYQKDDLLRAWKERRD